MLLIDNFLQVTAQIESERGISREDLIEAIGHALVSSCRRKFPEEALLHASINPETGEATIIQSKKIVKSIENPDTEISLKEAKKINPIAAVEQEITFDVTPGNFGRIAAQTAKQVIIQRIREAEKNSIYNEYIDKTNQIITGIVQRVENKNYLINLGRVESILAPSDQIPGERLSIKEKIKFYVADVKKTPRGPFVHISRSHAGFVKKLFELEIPEIQDGIIEIMSVSRDAGRRTKIAVKTNNPAIGAVGTCVGHMGGRIQSIIKELGNEKIDILEWHEDIKSFIASSLKPAKIDQVIITDEKEKTAVIVVPKDQLSLAIGKSGVNVRLAVKLTGWKIDILNSEEYSEKEGEIRSKAGLSIVEKIKLEKEKEKEKEKNELLLQKNLEAAKLTQSEKELPEKKPKKATTKKTTKKAPQKTKTAAKTEKTKTAAKTTKKKEVKKPSTKKKEAALTAK